MVFCKEVEVTIYIYIYIYIYIILLSVRKWLTREKKYYCKEEGKVLPSFCQIYKFGFYNDYFVSLINYLLSLVVLMPNIHVYLAARQIIVSHWKARIIYHIEFHKPDVLVLSIKQIWMGVKLKNNNIIIINKWKKKKRTKKPKSLAKKIKKEGKWNTHLTNHLAHLFLYFPRTWGKYNSRIFKKNSGEDDKERNDNGTDWGYLYWSWFERLRPEDILCPPKPCSRSNGSCFLEMALQYRSIFYALMLWSWK